MCSPGTYSRAVSGCQLCFCDFAGVGVIDACSWSHTAPLARCTCCWQSASCADPAIACLLACLPFTILQEQSSACLSCGPGSFAYSWGSAYCKSCIEGTYAPHGTQPQGQAGSCGGRLCCGTWTALACTCACWLPSHANPACLLRVNSAANSSLCLACPTNTTTLEDGQSSCDVPLSPGTYQAPRYAACLAAAACTSQPTSARGNCCMCWPPIPPCAYSPVARLPPASHTAGCPPCCTCRYAVVVSFYVILTGLDPEDVIVQVGGLWV